MKKIIVLICFFVFFVNANTSNNSNLLFPIMYVDMDGTTLGSDHQPRPATLKAYQRFKDCGGLLGISTGRTLEQVKPYISLVKPNLPLVLFNGVITYSPTGDKMVRQEALTEEIIHSLITKASSLQEVKGILIQFPTKTFADRDTSDMQKFTEWAHINITKTCDFNKCVLEDLRNNKIERPTKIEILASKSTADSVANELKNLFKDKAKVLITDTKYGVLNILPGSSNKAVAIKRVVEDRGYSMNDVVYFGDSQNDVDALGVVPLGIAMENCHPDSCKAATFVTGHHDTDAIANVINRLLIKSPKCF